MAEDKEMLALASNVYNIKKFYSDTLEIDGKKYYVLDRIDAGVNALTLGTKKDYDNMKAGHPEKVTEATVVFRGSEPLSVPSRMRDYGGGKEGLDKVTGEILFDWLGTDYEYLIKKQPFDNGKSNAFQLAADYVGKHLQTKFYNAKFNGVGHSLGGSEVKYVAFQYPTAINKVYSFEGPNIYPSLSKEQQELARSGYFNGKIFDYINLTDGLARLNRDEPAFGTQRIIWDSKARFDMTHQDMESYIREHPFLSIMDRTYDRFGGLNGFDAFLKKINPSLSYLMLSTFSDHDLGRYQFDGNHIQLFTGQKLEVTELQQIQDYLSYSGLGEYSAPMLLIRGETMLQIARHLEIETKELLDQMKSQLEELPDRVKTETDQLKHSMISLVGYGQYDQLTPNDVEEFHQELAIDGTNFYKPSELETSWDAYRTYKKETEEYIADIRTLAHSFLKLDEELARKMDLR
ncbi:hypothetical protein MFLO_13685 [Listeria floridensis FSL S10-1187]|uniref:Fungal lipase-like domain-containing protein n=1 Tax=Listeria floridensis FSL S10-1187 TaxID=1265817 RepID=A0ABP3AUU9_9LIST|nr:hypothetical protein [Listeria floridensis]EUJ26927.1 hypothetical protein MFLO_13685 [Listeria floridensis FSL S10-1187]